MPPQKAKLNANTLETTMTPIQLRKALDGLGLSQRELARQLQVNERSVRAWVLGENPIPYWLEVILREWKARKFTLPQ
jgi:DNA-binding transcriptional regulator YiaG